MVYFDMLDPVHPLHQKIDRDHMTLLHLIWENPERVAGGMGVAGLALCDALKDKVRVHVMTPCDRENNHLEDFNTYELDIGLEGARRLQERVENQQNLDGIMGAVADFARQVSAAQYNHSEKTSYSVVHAHDWMTAAAGVSVQRSLGIPLILHVHSTQIDREGAHANGAVYQHEKWAMQQADFIIAVSDYTKCMIEKHYGICAEKISVVRNASITDELSSSLNQNAERKPVVLFAGRLVTQKCPEMAVEIMVGVLKKMKNSRGVIVGGGEKLRVIRELVKFKGLAERIEVLGFMPQRNMRAVYDTASVLILPSISEPFGLVALEAAQAGVAVIMSDRCGASEVLKSAQVIELYQTDKWIDRVLELLENKSLREVQVCQQKNDIEGYSWSNAGEGVLKIVDQLVTR